MAANGAAKILGSLKMGYKKPKIIISKKKNIVKDNEVEVENKIDVDAYSKFGDVKVGVLTQTAVAVGTNATAVNEGAVIIG
jgi:hypothetical protein